VDIFLVRGASIPKMRMTVDDEYFFTLGCPVHGVSPAPASGLNMMGLAIGVAGIV
jgi:hypothetical protein